MDHSFFSLVKDFKAKGPALRVGDCMRSFTHWVSSEAPLEEVVLLAEKNLGTQLPVMSGKKLEGLFHLEDYHYIKGRSLKSSRLHLRDLLLVSPILVSPRAPLIEVCREMSNLGHDISVVMEKGLPIGFVGWREGVQVLLGLVG